VILLLEEHQPPRLTRPRSDEYDLVGAERSGAQAKSSAYVVDVDGEVVLLRPWVAEGLEHGRYSSIAAGGRDDEVRPELFLGPIA
jgi:hypothetical protein